MIASRSCTNMQLEPRARTRDEPIDPSNQPNRIDSTPNMHTGEAPLGGIDRRAAVIREAERPHHPMASKHESTCACVCKWGREQEGTHTCRGPRSLVYTNSRLSPTPINYSNHPPNIPPTEKDSDAGVSTSGGAPKSFVRRDHLRYDVCMLCVCVCAGGCVYVELTL